MDTINTSAQSGWLKMRLNVSTRVPTEVISFCSDRWINSFEFEVEVEDYFVYLFQELITRRFT
jgi:hypothetical protein